jgi:hypothetical protein
VPINASQTCSGQRLIKPIVEPVFYQSQRAVGVFSEETIEYFKLKNSDLEINAKANNHIYDHVK